MFLNLSSDVREYKTGGRFKGGVTNERWDSRQGESATSFHDSYRRFSIHRQKLLAFVIHRVTNPPKRSNVCHAPNRWDSSCGIIQYIISPNMSLIHWLLIMTIVQSPPS